MNPNLKDILLSIVGTVVAVVIGLFIYGGVAGLFHQSPAPSLGGIGAVGDLPIENYIPYVSQNGGIYTAQPVQFTAGWTESGGGSETGGVTIGANGTTINAIVFGTPKVIAYSNTIAASSTARVDLGSTGQVGGTIAGILPTDACDGFATTTVGAWLGVDVIGSFASSTAGYCTLQLANNTGATFTWSATASTSFAIQDIH